MNNDLAIGGLKKIFSYPFRAENWQRKFVIGSLVTLPSLLIPILPAVFLFGYYARIFKDIVVRKAEPSMPAWEDWETLFVDGLRVFGIWIIYFLPGILLFIFSYMILFFIALIDSLASSAGIQELLPFFGMTGMMGFLGFAILYMLAISFIIPVAIGHAVVNEDFFASFHIGAWWPILKANLLGFFISIVILLGLVMVTQFLVQFLYFTIFLCCLIPLILSPILFFITIIAAPLFGHNYLEGVAASLGDQAQEQAV
jgi:hypothetical protein